MQTILLSVVAETITKLERPDFRPFAIRLSDGSRHWVPTRDHCVVTRLLRRIELEHDDGSITQINPLHIASLEAECSSQP